MGIASLESKSVKKKLKDKAFAAKVDREIIRSSIERLGVDFDQHIQFVIDALKRLRRLSVSCAANIAEHRLAPVALTFRAPGVVVTLAAAEIVPSQSGKRSSGRLDATV